MKSIEFNYTDYVPEITPEVQTREVEVKPIFEAIYKEILQEYEKEMVRKSRKKKWWISDEFIK